MCLPPPECWPAAGMSGGGRQAGWPRLTQAEMLSLQVQRSGPGVFHSSPQRRQKAQQGESVPREGGHSFPASAMSYGSLKTQQAQHPPLT